MKKNINTYLKKVQVKPGKKFSLEKEHQTSYTEKFITKEKGEDLLSEGLKNLAKMQDKLYAHDEFSVLIILQAMDAAGKDGAIKHVLAGLNPKGVKVVSFQAPTSDELDHDYFWRHYKELPARGEIGIFNRSYYENVLVTRVHPELILNEKLPQINSVKDIDKTFWKTRFKQINHFEKNLTENGMVILKLFLNVSKEEQKKRFLERIDNPEKNWKFSVSDTEERKHWDKYMIAYEEMMAATSTSYAPWFVIPADDKWYTRLLIGGIITRQFEKLKLSYPKVSKEQILKLQKAKKELLAER